jgi:hypothetical protein
MLGLAPRSEDRQAGALGSMKLDFTEWTLVDSSESLASRTFATTRSIVASLQACSTPSKGGNGIV